MSSIALNTASTGLNALSTALDVTANNLANIWLSFKNRVLAS